MIEKAENKKVNKNTLFHARVSKTYHDLLLNDSSLDIASKLHDWVLFELKDQFATVHPLAVYVRGIFELDEEAECPHRRNDFFIEILQRRV